jgi:hypothetical protein
VGPIYGPEDLLGGWVSKRKKRKADPGLQLPAAKKRATGEISQPGSREVCDSDADDEDDLVADENDSQQLARESQDDDGQQSVGGTLHKEAVAKDAAHVVSSIERAKGDGEAASAPVIGSSHEPASSQSSSDGQNPVARIEKDARAALHQIEVVTGVVVSSRHRGPMIDQSLALGGRDALESFRQACSCWRRDYASQSSQGLSAAQGSDVWHPALHRFSRAYHDAKNTTLRRAALDLLHRINLAHLYDIYLEALQELTGHSLQPKAAGLGTVARARDVFTEDACDLAKNQMFWACYPEYKGKPRSSVTSLDRTFRTTLAHAEKWYTLREEFSMGILALVPPGANTWFEKLPLKDLPVFFYLVRAVNPATISMGEKISGRVLSSWRGEAPPELLLRLEHLETIDEIPFKANPLKLLEEVNIGCTAGGIIGRAVTVPIEVDENDATALNAVFSSVASLSQGGHNEYQLPPGFFDGIDFSGA